MLIEKARFHCVLSPRQPPTRKSIPQDLAFLSGDVIRPSYQRGGLVSPRVAGCCRIRWPVFFGQNELAETNSKNVLIYAQEKSTGEPATESRFEIVAVLKNADSNNRGQPWTQVDGPR